MGRIVVGIDGSAGSREALRFALSEARRRRSSLVAVHAFRLPLVEAPGPFSLAVPIEPVPGLAEVQQALERAAVELLDTALDEAAGDAGGIEVERSVVEGDPAQALLEASQGAELLVVGARGHGGFAGLLLGSVADQLVRHAPCPVVVVPWERGA